MKTKTIIFFFLFVTSFSFGQADTIRLQKVEHFIYRCSNPSARYWYIYQDESTFYLVNLTINEADIEDWFKRFLNSQNLYTSKVVLRNGHEFFQFTKPNALEERLYFEVIRRNKKEILTLSVDTGEEFNFSRLEF